MYSELYARSPKKTGSRRVLARGRCGPTDIERVGSAPSRADPMPATHLTSGQVVVQKRTARSCLATAPPGRGEAFSLWSLEADELSARQADGTVHTTMLPCRARGEHRARRSSRAQKEPSSLSPHTHVPIPTRRRHVAACAWNPDREGRLGHDKWQGAASLLQT
eukprot:scaffold6996_cov112-Isochrysis_galbana.AAC.12